jgi:hypothetical protein
MADIYVFWNDDMLRARKIADKVLALLAIESEDEDEYLESADEYITWLDGLKDGEELVTTQMIDLIKNAIEARKEEIWRRLRS